MKRASPILSVVLGGCGAAEKTTHQESEVIGGSTARAGQIPFQARLLINGDFVCGGSLIHPSWVMTAAHCVIPDESYVVRLGDLTWDAEEPGEQEIPVSRIVVHPNFVGRNLQNDIALFRLASPARITKSVGLVRLPENDSDSNEARVSGWGWTKGRGFEPSNDLMYANLPLVRNQVCDAAPELFRDLFDNEICAGFLEGERGGCHGDSGGPLVVGQTQVGIVSWGDPLDCASYTVFARVHSHLDFIYDTIGPTEIIETISDEWRAENPRDSGHDRWTRRDVGQSFQLPGSGGSLRYVDVCYFNGDPYGTAPTGAQILLRNNIQSDFVIADTLGVQNTGEDCGIMAGLQNYFRFYFDEPYLFGGRRSYTFKVTGGSGHSTSAKDAYSHGHLWEGEAITDRDLDIRVGYYNWWRHRRTAD